MNLIKFLTLLLFVSCASNTERIEHISEINEFTKGNNFLENEIETQPEFSELKKGFVAEDLNLIEVKSLKGFTKKEVNNFWNYLKIVNNITQTDCFENYLVNYQGLLNNKSETRNDLVKNLRSERPALNFVMYYKNNGVVGYTYPNSDTIWLNRKFHQNYTLEESAANLAHERSHKLGYTHDFKRTSRRVNQVPYPVGSAIKACFKNKDFDITKAKKIKVCKRSWRNWLWLKPVCYWTIKNEGKIEK